MRKLLLSFTAALLLSSVAIADSGLISVKSPHDVNITADRLEKVLAEKGMNVFMRLNHTKAAQRVGTELRPTELLIFGNPKVGAPLMQCAQSVAIDLPQKALIWEDEHGQTWLSYNAPKYLAQRHQIPGCAKVINKIDRALSHFAAAATAP